VQYYYFFTFSLTYMGT